MSKILSASPYTEVIDCLLAADSRSAGDSEEEDDEDEDEDDDDEKDDEDDDYDGYSE